MNDHPTVQDLKNADIDHQNFAFGYDNEGIPFFTIYFRSQEEHGVQRADITPSSNHAITHIQNNTIINNQKLTSMNPNELMASETEFGPELEPSQETLSEVTEVAAPSEESRVEPSDCSCQSKGGSTSNAAGSPSTDSNNKKVYVIGELSIQFGSHSKRTAFEQYSGISAEDSAAVATFLKGNPSEAETVLWVLSIQSVPVYVIRPTGAYAAAAYTQLIEMFESQFTEKVERVAIPGIRRGSSKLDSGQVVPVIVPSIRAMASWSTDALLDAVAKDQGKKANANVRQRLQDFLNRTYFELRNAGVTSQERALNFAASNAFQVGNIIQSAMEEGLELGGFNVTKSPIGMAGEDNWDVQMVFFNPLKRAEQSAKIFAFTVDVATISPFLVGDVRTWYKY